MTVSVRRDREMCELYDLLFPRLAGVAILTTYSHPSYLILPQTANGPQPQAVWQTVEGLLNFATCSTFPFTRACLTRFWPDEALVIQKWPAEQVKRWMSMFHFLLLCCDSLSVTQHSKLLYLLKLVSCDWYFFIFTKLRRGTRSTSLSFLGKFFVYVSQAAGPTVWVGKDQSRVRNCTLFNLFTKYPSVQPFEVKLDHFSPLDKGKTGGGYSAPLKTVIDFVQCKEVGQNIICLAFADDLSLFIGSWTMLFTTQQSWKQFVKLLGNFKCIWVSR